MGEIPLKKIENGGGVPAKPSVSVSQETYRRLKKVVTAARDREYDMTMQKLADWGIDIAIKQLCKQLGIKLKVKKKKKSEE